MAFSKTDVARLSASYAVQCGTVQPLGKVDYTYNSGHADPPLGEEDKFFTTVGEAYDVVHDTYATLVLERPSTDEPIFRAFYDEKTSSYDVYWHEYMRALYPRLSPCPLRPPPVLCRETGRDLLRRDRCWFWTGTLSFMGPKLYAWYARRGFR